MLNHANRGRSGVVDTLDMFIRCCPRSNITRQDWRDLVRTAKDLKFPDTVPTCSLSHKMFKDNFIKQSKVNTVSITIVFRITNMVMIVINLSTKIRHHL